MRARKVYNLEITDYGFYKDRTYRVQGTFPELLERFRYTLESGARSYAGKKHKKINLEPKNIRSLITNLYNAHYNCSRTGQVTTKYSIVEA